MGLAERRAIEQFKAQRFADIDRKVSEAAGFKVVIEVDWSSLAIEKYAHRYAEFFEKIYFDPLIAALRSVCSDDMGQRALKKALVKVVITNTRENFYPTGFRFVDGVLDLDHHPASNVERVDDRAKAIIKLLEAAL